jgi:hypothetical protein
MKLTLQRQFGEYFEEIPAESVEISSSDIASEHELQHYMYLYGSEAKAELRCMQILGKESFTYSWINRPAQYLHCELGESLVS